MLLILHEDPYEAAKRVPQYYKHKQLLELMQMLSCVVNFGYEKIPQGKKIKEWMSKNIDWTYIYTKTLFRLVKEHLKEETCIKYKCLIDLLELRTSGKISVPNATTGIFRYKEGYTSNYESNVELPIEECCKEYEKYLEWKLGAVRK